MTIQVQKLDRTTLRAVNAAINEALKTVGLEGAELSIGSTRFGTTEATIKLNLRVVSPEAEQNRANDKENLLAIYMNMFSIKSKVGTGVAAGHTLVEYNTKGKKYPFITEKGGKQYKMSLLQVQTCFK